MELTYPQPSQTRTLTVSAFCLLGISIASYLLHRDYQTAGPAAGEAMGLLEQASDEVRRKQAASFAWRPVFAGATIFRRDSIKVGSGGFASIKLADGSRLEVAENSLVVVDREQNAELRYVHGSFVLRGATGDQQISVATDGKTTTKALGARLLFPRPDSRLATSGREAEIPFRWEPLRGAQVAAARLQIAQSADFSGPVREIPLGAKAATGTKVALPAGHWYWRLAGRSGPLTEAMPLAVTPVEPPAPLSPAEGADIEVWEKSQPLVFRWVTPASAVPGVTHRIQIARDASFRKPWRGERIEATAGSATLTGPGEGTWFWRIESRLGDVAVASRPVAFRMSKGKRLKAPESTDWEVE